MVTWSMLQLFRQYRISGSIGSFLDICVDNIAEQYRWYWTTMHYVKVTNNLRFQWKEDSQQFSVFVGDTLKISGACAFVMNGASGNLLRRCNTCRSCQRNGNNINLSIHSKALSLYFVQLEMFKEKHLTCVRLSDFCLGCHSGSIGPWWTTWSDHDGFAYRKFA